MLYVSTHEYPFYPGTGAAREIGAGAGRGYNINIPMPHGCGDDEYRRAFEEVVLPALRRYRPELILVSAGYDAHFADEIAGEQLSVDGYGALVSMLQAGGGRAVRRPAARCAGGRLPPRRAAVVRAPHDRGAARRRADAGSARHVGDATRRAAFDAMLAEVKALHGL